MRKLAIIGFLTVVLVIFHLTGLGQVNTEKFRKYSQREGFIFNTSFRFGYSDGNSKYLSMDGTFRVDYNGIKNNAFIVGNYEYKETEASIVVNKGFLHLRGIHPLTNTLSLEGFLQQEFNEFLYLNDRKLVGGNMRIPLLDLVSKKDSITSFNSNFGFGLMYEHEIYDVQTGEELTTAQNTIRSSLYLTLDLNISNRFNCWAVGYFQPNIKYLNDFRTVVETGMEFWIINRLFFTIDVSYRYNNQPVGDVSKFDLVIKNGLRYSIP